MEKSTENKKLFTALLKFNAEMGKVAKTSNNPFFKSKYAALPDILDAIAEPLRNAGLVIIQIPDGEGLTCIVAHAESGEYISAMGIMKPVKNDPQAIGSAITYQRRYSIASILNLNIDEDDDGNKASGNQIEKLPEQPEKQWLSDKNYNIIYGRILKGEKDLYQKTLDTYKMKKEFSSGLKDAFDSMDFNKEVK